MLVRFLFLWTLSSLLFGEIRVKTAVEAGLFLPKLSGTVENVHSGVDFKNDFRYTNASSSYFGATFLLDYDYVPAFQLGYLNMQENSHASLDKNVTIADGTFGADVDTTVDFQLFQALVYKNFRQKGKTLSFLRRKFYSGDFAFGVGMSVKYLQWKFNVVDQSDLTKTPSWISVNSFIPLPYIGMKYYLYGFQFYGDLTALSFVRAKSLGYQAGFVYNVVDTLFVGASYMYEGFKAVEKRDTVNFTIKGYKFGFMYSF